MGSLGPSITILEFPELKLPRIYNVVINGRDMPAGPGGITWKDGRPFVNRQEAAPLLGLSREGEPSLDLFQALKTSSYTVEFDGTETIKCIPPAKAITLSHTNVPTQRYVEEMHSQNESIEKVKAEDLDRNLHCGCLWNSRVGVDCGWSGDNPQRSPGRLYRILYDYDAGS